MNKKNTIKKILLIIIIFIIASTIGYIAVTGNIYNYKICNLFEKNTFKYFYDTSSLILNHKIDEVYNQDYTYKSQPVIFRPKYSPLMFYFYAPFANLPYTVGLILNIVFFIISYLLCISLLIFTFRRLYKYRYVILLFSLLFPPFILSIFNGSPSVLWLLILALSFTLAKKDSPFAAGIIMSFFILKPSILIMIYIIIIFSFRPRIFLGLITGTLVMIILAGMIDSFYLWSKWLTLVVNDFSTFIRKDVIRTYSLTYKNFFFYPMFSQNKFISIIEYIFVIAGFFSIFGPIIYSYNNKNHFSRNSFWFILTLSLILSNPYFINFDLSILMLPLIILLNLLFADRVKTHVIILILIIFPIAIILFYLIGHIIHVQFLAILFWFLHINGTMAIRIRNYMPKTFRGYWDDY